jgi:dipeptidyl aminopeptidase/acylaminoacyl peptidase
MFDGLLNPNGEQIADKMIIEQSPHNLLKKNKGKCKPILIIHGKEDKRVPIEQAEEAQKCFGCELLAFDNEGHCITKSENTITRYLKIFKFLDEHMG